MSNTSFQYSSCEDPVESAISRLSDAFKSVESDINQILNSAPVAASGEISVIDPTTMPPYDWGTPPTQSVTISPEGVVSVSSISPDPDYSISVGAVSIFPYLDFHPEDPKSGTFAEIEIISGVKHFRSRYQISGSGTITASAKAFSFPSGTFTAANIGMTLRVAVAMHSENLQDFIITGIADDHTVICGDASGIVDDPSISGKLCLMRFNSDDAANNRLLRISAATPVDNGTFKIVSTISPDEVTYEDIGAPTATVPFGGLLVWSVSLTIRELLYEIATAPQFAAHTLVNFFVESATSKIRVVADAPGVAGNKIGISLGSKLTFLQTSGTYLTGGLDGNLQSDAAASTAAISDTISSTNTILALGGTSADTITLQQNVIPPGSNPNDLVKRLQACGFAAVGKVPLVKDNRDRMKGYSDFYDLCGFEILRAWLRDQKPGARYVVSIELVPKEIRDLTSCGTSTVDELSETPSCGVLPKDAPDAVRFYVFHHTKVETTSGTINTLFSQGFTATQSATILSPNGAVGAGIVSIVIPYTTAIEEAISAGFTPAEVEKILTDGVENWSYDAERSALRDLLAQKLQQARTSDTAKSCYTTLWGLVDESKLSGTAAGREQLNSNVCAVVDIGLKKVLNYIFSQADKLRDLLAKVKKISDSLAAALSFNDFVNKTLRGFPNNETMKCLLGGINVSAEIPGIPGAAIGGAADAISGFASGISAKVNNVGALVTGIISRAQSVLNLTSQSSCLLKSTISGLLSNSSPIAAKVFDCLSSGFDLNLPTCTINVLNEILDLIDLVDSSLNLALSMAANLSLIATNMTKLDVTTPLPESNSNCSTGIVDSFLGSVGLGTPSAIFSL